MVPGPCHTCLSRRGRNMSCWDARQAYPDRPSSEAASLEADAALFGRNRGREFMSGAKGKKHQGAGVQDVYPRSSPTSVTLMS